MRSPKAAPLSLSKEEREALEKRLCCKKLQSKKLGGIVPHNLSSTATPNSVATSATCSLMSPFATPCTCPFLSMFIISYPWKVRQAVSKKKKPIPGFAKRLMKR